MEDSRRTDAMKTLLFGVDPQKANTVQLAMRVRWSDATVLVAGQADQGLELVEREEPDVVICQASPNGKPLTKFIEQLRSFSDVPLVVLEQDDGGGDMDEVRALDAGADEYVRQSAGLVELVAKLVALMRRVRGAELWAENRRLSTGPLLLNPATSEAFLNGNRLALTPTEFRLLHLLFKNRGNVVTQRFIAVSLWGDAVDSAAVVRKYIQRLRSKLGDDWQKPQWIANIYGVGYKFLGSSS